MPYTAVVTGGKGKKKVAIKKHGKTIAHSSSMAKANASIRARNAGEHGWKPSGKRRKR